MKYWRSEFNEGQLQEIRFSWLYAKKFRHGTLDGNTKLIIAKMTKLLDDYEAILSDIVIPSDSAENQSKQSAEQSKEWPGNYEEIVSNIAVSLDNAKAQSEQSKKKVSVENGKKAQEHLSSPPLNTGDVLRMELGNGIVRSWEIEGFYYGGVGEEGVIELRAMGYRQPTVSRFREPYDKVEMFVPSNLIHGAIVSGLLEVYRPNLAASKNAGKI